VANAGEHLLSKYGALRFKPQYHQNQNKNTKDRINLFYMLKELEEVLNKLRRSMKSILKDMILQHRKIISISIH
jgi:hypothetical protein